MTWPAHPTRAEVLRLLEINRDQFHHWVISREETEVVMAMMRELGAIKERAEHELYLAGCIDDGVSPTMRLLWRILGRDRVPQVTERGEAE